MAFAIIRPFLNEATANKVRIVGGSDGSQWAKTLLEEIDADQLPAHYGGTMTDPDGNPECITKVFKSRSANDDGISRFVPVRFVRAVWFRRVSISATCSTRKVKPTKRSCQFLTAPKRDWNSTLKFPDR